MTSRIRGTCSKEIQDNQTLGLDKIDNCKQRASGPSSPVYFARPIPGGTRHAPNALHTGKAFTIDASSRTVSTKGRLLAQGTGDGTAPSPVDASLLYPKSKYPTQAPSVPMAPPFLEQCSDSEWSSEPRPFFSPAHSTACSSTTCIGPQQSMISSTCVGHRHARTARPSPAGTIRTHTVAEDHYHQLRMDLPNLPCQCMRTLRGPGCPWL